MLHTQSYQEEADALEICKEETPGDDITTELLFSYSGQTWYLEHMERIRPSSHSCKAAAHFSRLQRIDGQACYVR